MATTEQVQKLMRGRDAITEGLASFGIKVEWDSEGLPSIDVSGFHKHNETPRCPGCSTDGSNALGLHGHLHDCIYNPQRRWD